MMECHSQPGIRDFTNKEVQHIFYYSLATQGSPDFGTEVLQTMNSLKFPQVLFCSINLKEHDNLWLEDEFSSTIW